MNGCNRTTPRGAGMPFRKRRSAGRRSGAVLVSAVCAALAGCESSAMRQRNQGLALYHQHRFHAALAKFDEALEHHPADPRANYYAGATQYRLQHYEQAAYHYKLAWTADPAFPHIASATALSYIKAGKPNQAMNFLERDAALTHSMRARLRVAAFYERTGDMDDARANLVQAVRGNPGRARPWMALGQFYDRIGRKREAGQSYAAAYRINPFVKGLVAKMQRDGVSLSQAIGMPPPTRIKSGPARSGAATRPALNTGR